MTDIAKRGEFLPETYQVPDKNRQFMKLTPGDNNIRILSAPLLGFVIFTEDKKPVRKPIEEGDFTIEELESLKAKKNDNGEYEGSKHFWIMLVWSYEAEAPKILEITQISVLKPLHELSQKEKWGDLRDYDIDITRVGTGKLDTEFSVMPEPKEELSNEIRAVVGELEEKKLLDLNAIWKGEYPFEIYNW
ncbi:hypothetical protein [Carboxylicivirga marina]|uniref:DUF402 domain-containing protein n=1 Tax=Carboxylicivirga marina TaxID=2800988 RepID=A0ABS1HG90_9BACT|nr:hypothetical protein [Carboxylicivirga marina]MBK3516681.1 hypothetical protein [Carboxylicivirga marina]